MRAGYIPSCPAKKICYSPALRYAMHAWLYPPDSPLALHTFAGRKTVKRNLIIEDAQIETLALDISDALAADQVDTKRIDSLVDKI